MKPAEIWRRWKPEPANELLVFLITYMFALLAVLLLVHLLQPEREEGSGSSSRSPTHRRGRRNRGERSPAHPRGARAGAGEVASVPSRRLRRRSLCHHPVARERSSLSARPR